ncbi:MAG: hypothetical protein JSV66_11750 [Trueperaceae bacterium]|nr:MAG: hypothetical protein JSV66_11750 [Trueperaceae bacterium]
MHRKTLSALYIVLLLTLATLGVHNQQQFRLQHSLIQEKDSQHQRLAELRGMAASITSPLAVSQWAASSGMIPATEAGDFEQVTPLTSPEPIPLESGLEVRTVWR